MKTNVWSALQSEETLLLLLGFYPSLPGTVRDPTHEDRRQIDVDSPLFGGCSCLLAVSPR